MSISRFETQAQIDTYLARDEIQCLECGKWFKTLGRHLTTTHGMTANDYRDKYGLPRSTPLAGLTTRYTLSNQMFEMIRVGVVTHDHIRDAAKNIDTQIGHPKKA